MTHPSEEEILVHRAWHDSEAGNMLSFTHCMIIFL